MPQRRSRVDGRWLVRAGCKIARTEDFSTRTYGLRRPGVRGTAGRTRVGRWVWRISTSQPVDVLVPLAPVDPKRGGRIRRILVGGSDPESESGPASENVPAVRHPPRLRTILGHLLLSLLTAVVVPGVLFAVSLVMASVWAALVVAITWCYGAIAWRALTRRRMSGLTILTVVGLTGRTALAFASGNTYIYFLQPVINNVILALLFLLSLATARPVVARLAADFYPMSADVAKRPRVQRLFWQLTLLWAFVCLAKAVATLWLLQSQSLVSFIMVKNVVFLGLTVAAVAVTVFAALWVARRENPLKPA